MMSLARRDLRKDELYEIPVLTGKRRDLRKCQLHCTRRYLRRNQLNEVCGLAVRGDIQKKNQWSDDAYQGEI